MSGQARQEAGSGEMKFTEGSKEYQWTMQAYRDLAILLCRILVPRRVVPNHVSLLSIFLGLVSAAFFAAGRPDFSLWGLIPLHLSVLLDFVDGELARRRKMTSTLGKWIDWNADVLVEMAVLAGVALGGFLRSGSDSFLTLGLLLLISRVLCYNLYVALFACFPSTKNQFGGEMSTLLSQFIPTRVNIFLLLAAFVVLDRVGLYIRAAIFWQLSFYLAAVFYVALKIDREEKPR